jgi:ribosomal 30S subunit maturation factor RimM
MRAHQIRLHGASGELEVELEGDNPRACLDQLQTWMREGAHVELHTRRGTARVSMGLVWAAEYVPSGRVIAE